MERYWRIAISVANTYLEEFLSDLVGDVRLLLEIADEARHTTNAKIWLFKYQRWDENDDLIKPILASLSKLPDSAYLYIAIKSPFMTQINRQGALNAIEYFKAEYGTRTGNFLRILISKYALCIYIL